MENFGEQVRAAREAKGWSQEELARRVGATQSTIDRIESGATKRPRNIIELATTLGIDLPTFQSQPVPVTGWIAAPEAPEVDKGLYPRDVPILGISSCGDGDDADFSLNGQTGDYARRPPGLIGKRNVYAINVFGESMWPAHKHGALLYVDPKREPGVGEDAVIEMKPDSPHGEPGKGFLKRVKRLAGSKIECEQFNPPEPRVFHRSEIKSFHRVIPWEEVLGY